MYCEDTSKLYLVRLKGMTYSTIGPAYGLSYVVANDIAEAYKIVRKFLDDNNLGFARQRELDCITLLAETYQYTDAGAMLFI
jgi:hypothetical protein